MKFYDDDQLHIYKSNKLRDWTEFKAIGDANETTPASRRVLQHKLNRNLNK